MVEFNFDLKPLFPEEIVKICSQDLAPSDGYYVDPDAWFKIPQLKAVINHMGELSAVAQGLKSPITSADKMKFSDDTKLYMMATSKNRAAAGGKIGVVGLLKVGRKDLYLYDEMKQQRKVRRVPCILDFYVYESCQRCGYGKKLFERMLKEENWKPNKCSIDRPSEKLTGFLKKHYGLEKTIPQGYKFVLYKGFFDNIQNDICSQDADAASKSGGGNNERQIRLAREIPYKQGQGQTSISSEHFGSCLDTCSTIPYNSGLRY